MGFVENDEAYQRGAHHGAHVHTYTHNMYMHARFYPPLSTFPNISEPLLCPPILFPSSLSSRVYFFFFCFRKSLLNTLSWRAGERSSAGIPEASQPGSWILGHSNMVPACSPFRARVAEHLLPGVGLLLPLLLLLLPVGRS